MTPNSSTYSVLCLFTMIKMTKNPGQLWKYLSHFNPRTHGKNLGIVPSAGEAEKGRSLRLLSPVLSVLVILSIFCLLPTVEDTQWCPHISV